MKDRSIVRPLALGSPRRRRGCVALLGLLTLLLSFAPASARDLDPTSRELRGHLGTLTREDEVFLDDAFTKRPPDTSVADLIKRPPQEACFNAENDAVMCYDYTLTVVGWVEPGMRLLVGVDSFHAGISPGVASPELVVTDPGGKECRANEAREAFHGAELEVVSAYSQQVFYPTRQPERPNWSCPPPTVGTYKVTLINKSFAATSFTLRAKLEKPARQPTNPKLMVPNLVPWPPPWDFEFGCRELDDGHVERLGRECLRFAFAYANSGRGMFDVRFDPLTQPAGSEAPATQRIYLEDATPGDYSDNEFDEIPAGEFVLHESHRHWHYKDVIHSELFRITGRSDLTDPVTAMKQGVCISSWYMIDFHQFFHDPANAGASSGCNVSASVPHPPTERVRLPLPAGWGDFYSSGLPDNFVDFTGLGDGEFLLRVTVNPYGTIREANYDDNVAYAHIRVQTTEEESTVCLIERGMGLDPWSGRELDADASPRCA